jgi:hypothetical protein
VPVRTFKPEAALSDADWEALHAPYDQPTYQAVLDRLRPDDIALEIGAGDLRLARQMAAITRRVYAVEIHAAVLQKAHPAREPLPSNLIAICADARIWDFPPEITTGVLMMRHCRCFRLYADKLRSVGATRIITNARWRMDVEVVDLGCSRVPYMDAGIGWYACLCGGTGFKEGPAESWSFEMDKIIQEVSGCPQCMEATKNMSF